MSIRVNAKNETPRVRGGRCGSPRLRAAVAAITIASSTWLLAPRASRADGDAAFKLEPPAMLEGQRRPRHLGRAALETAGILLGGTVWYWRDLEFNARDWDLRWDAQSWRRKLTFESVRFDQNLFQTNAASHARAGVAHYEVARGNGLGVGASMGVTAATSLLWEFVIEFKEQPAINDFVVNNVAGLAIGEPFYQLGEFFQRSRPTLLNRGLAGAFSPVASMNDWVDDRRRPHEAYDALGFTREASHRFHLSGAYEKSTYDEITERRETGLSAGAELVTLPGYGKQGRFSRSIPAGSWTSIAGQLELDDRGIAGGALLSRVALLGHYSQNFRNTPHGLRGLGTLVGVGTGFNYEDRGRPGADDYMAVMNIAGPIFEMVGRSNGFRLRLAAELYGDFAMVKSLAFEGRLPEMIGGIYHPGEYGGRIPGVLGARGYYYALGFTAGSRLTLEYWGWDLGGELRTDHFDSIEGYDRFREEMIDEYDLVDKRTIARAWIGLRPWKQGPRLFSGMEWRFRRGTAESFVGEYRDLRVQAGVSIPF
ncbi:MAG TPA: DUF3943 domain-containing protein [Polyangia bacterium]